MTILDKVIFTIEGLTEQLYLDDIINNYYPEEITRTYGVINDLETLTQSYMTLAYNIGLIDKDTLSSKETWNSENVDKVKNIVLQDEGMLKAIQEELAETIDFFFEVSCMGTAEELVKEFSYGKPEMDFINENSDYIDFDGIAWKWLMYDNVKFFDGEFYILD